MSGDKRQSDRLAEDILVAIGDVVGRPLLRCIGSVTFDESLIVVARLESMLEILKKCACRWFR